MGDSRSDAAMLELCTEVSSSSPYEMQFEALPMLFLKRSTKQQQKKSLRHHAEKKALSEMLAHGCESLEIGVNFHMCVDCHAFFKGASLSLGRRIEVREPSVLHRFNEGACSCNDQWRWEARFIGGSQSQSSNRLPRLPSNERGDDDELAVTGKICDDVAPGAAPTPSADRGFGSADDEDAHFAALDGVKTAMLRERLRQEGRAHLATVPQTDLPTKTPASGAVKSAAVRLLLRRRLARVLAER